MLFNSTEFLIFLPVVCCLYFMLPYRFRWMLLLAASYYFYASWNPMYLLLILASTAVDYCAGLIMGAATRKSIRLACLFGSLVVNLGLLFTFKYANFFNDILRTVFERFGMTYTIADTDWLLPVGISFYTFQTLSYTIEVYRETHAPERHLGVFALYVAFFPQLVAGPIERSHSFLPQLFKRYDFDYARVVSGLRLVLWGMFKKVVIADNLAKVVDHVYANSDKVSGPVLVIGTVFFAYQIYCDFSGYTDIAIGSARIMGYRLRLNFDQPYRARSITEFWRRWHISLSTWFRDYVFIPMGGSRAGIPRLYANILIVFVVSGLWHGSKWTFLAWGGLHGLYYVIGHITKPVRGRLVSATRLDRAPRAHGVIQWAITFALVCVAWVFFRADDIQQASAVVTGMGNGWGGVVSKSGLHAIYTNLGVSRSIFGICVASIVFLEIAETFKVQGEAPNLLSVRMAPVRWFAYVALILCVFNLGRVDAVPFIYFQF